MKNSVIIIALFSLLCAVNAQSQSTTVSPSDASARGIKHTIWEQIKQLRSDLKQMTTDGQVDDKKMIKDVSALATAVQVGLEGTSAQLQSQLARQITAIQAQIKAMTTSGKFDASVLRSFHDLAKSIRIEPKTSASTTVVSRK